MKGAIDGSEDLDPAAQQQHGALDVQPPKAKAVPRHERVEEILQGGPGKKPGAQKGGRPPAGTEEFGSPEHQTYGNEGAHQGGYDKPHQQPTFDEISGKPPSSAFHFSLTHGDIVMLSGDYFDPRDKDENGKPVPDNLFALAATPSPKLGQTVGTQDEVLWAMKDANSADPRFAKEGIYSKIQFSQAVEDAAHSRYLRLASTNYEHFVNPKGPNSGGPKSGNRNSAGGSYRALHEDAIHRAHEAKKAGQPIDDAMAHEAASEHFLTDGFAAGHLRTPRKEIETYWGAKYPLFFENFKKTVAQDVAIYMNDNETNPDTVLGSVLDIQETVLAGVDEATATIPAIGFDAIVATLTHDVDNAEGLLVTNDIGQSWRTFGDSHGGVVNPKAGQEDTKLHVEEAVKVSVQDIQHAYDVPVAANDTETIAQVHAQTSAPAKPKDTYAAEQLMPFPDPAHGGENGVQNWRQPDFQTLWGTPIRSDKADQTFGAKIQASAKGGDIHDQLDSFTAKFKPVQSHGATHHPEVAYKNTFLKQMTDNPRAKVQAIIDYDPAKGQASARDQIATMHDLDRLQHQGNAKKDQGVAGAGGTSEFKGLTFNQRVEYVKNLETTEGWWTDNKAGWRIYDMFDTAPPAERRALYKALEGHEWSGEFVHGAFVADDDIWNNLERGMLDSLQKMLNASP